MHRLSIVVFSIICPTLMGVGAVVALVAGAGAVWPILGAAFAGAACAVPLSFVVARALRGS